MARDDGPVFTLWQRYEEPLCHNKSALEPLSCEIRAVADSLRWLAPTPRCGECRLTSMASKEKTVISQNSPYEKGSTGPNYHHNRSDRRCECSSVGEDSLGRPPRVVLGVCCVHDAWGCDQTHCSCCGCTINMWCTSTNPGFGTERVSVAACKSPVSHS